ncbi:hypothetical protein [Clostridioides sp. ZZV15-6598]|uniref:hypothetical protein n=1 Tax=Clostridioides sp. ZZV15-6598 TaxID=2811501 RepID=UPI001D1305C9|nr:hypothetical protein [Clostridioides sp. ZZV15-6598]
MEKTLKTIMEQIKIVMFIYIIICFGQAIALKTQAKDLLIGSIFGFILVIIAIVIKNFVKRPNLPGFAWATLVAFALSLPISPVGDFIASNIGKINFMSTVTPLLAFAGISVGNQLDILKTLSWKLVVISFIVMTSTYFGSAFISQTVLKINGMI